MARVNLPNPDSISGDRSIGTPFADLAVKARPVSEYRAPTMHNIPDAVREGGLSQLGDALARFNPALSGLAVQTQKVWDAKDVAAAQKRYGEVRMEYAEAVEKGMIPAGASRAYIETYKGLELDTKAQRYGQMLHKSYDESGLKDSDDPAAMDKFLSDHLQGFRSQALMREGQDRYTPLEIANSKFDEKLQGHVNSMLAQHIQYRADERTKIGKETAQTNAGVKIDNLFISGHPNSTAAAAQAVVGSFFDPLTGIGANGITKSEANKLMVDTIASKMVQYEDMDIQDIAREIKTHGDARLWNTQYARTKFREAEDHIISTKIRNSNWDWQRRERNALEDGGFGPEQQAQLKIEEEKRKTERWKHQDEMDAHALRMANRSEVMAGEAIKANSHVSVILTGLDAKDMNNPRVQRSFDWLKYNDPDKFMAMQKYAISHKKEKEQFIDTTASDMAYANLRYEMSRSPMTFDIGQAINASNNGTINPKNLPALLDDWDKAKVHVDNPYLQNESFKRLVDDVRKLAVKDAADLVGPGSVNAMRAEQQLRSSAYEWIDKNPGKTFLDFHKAMREHSELIALDVAPEFAKQEQRTQAKKVNPPAVPQKDTRSFGEKVLPTGMGGKDKPAPIKPEPTAQPPISPSQAFEWMQPSQRDAIKKLMLDPQADEMDLKVALYNSGLWASMKSNGRSAVEFQTIADDLLKLRKRK